jgi:Ca2+/H+ antiporter
MVVLYGMFLRLQTTKHSYFFSYRYAETGSQENHHHGSIKTSISLLVIGVILIGLLSEVMAKTMDAGLAGSGVPPIVAAVLVAFISASPEIPDRSTRSTCEPHATRRQYRSGRFLVHRDPHRTGHGSPSIIF